MPLAADESQKKHYLVCYGQLAETMITSGDVSPDFYYEKKEAHLSLKRQLSKEEIDPVQILISYRKIRKEQFEIELLNKKKLKSN